MSTKMGAIAPKGSSRRKVFVGFAIVVLVAIFTTGIYNVISGGSSTAAYTSTEKVDVTVSTAGLELNKTGDITLTGLVPGAAAKTANVTFSTVAGDVEGKLTIGAPFTVDNWVVPAGQTPNPNQVLVTIKDTIGNVYVAGKKLTQLSPQIDLGTLNSGSENAKTYIFGLTIVSAGDTADNQFKNMSFAGSVIAKVTSTA